MKVHTDRIPSKRVRQLDPQDKRDRILKAAFQLFSQDGYESVAISAIVREAGVAQGTLYRYFPGKSEILESLIAQMDAAIVAAIGPILSVGAEQFPLQAFFVRLMKAALEALQPYLPLISALQSEALWFGSSTQAQQRRAPQLQAIGGILRQRQLRGELPKHLSIEAATIVVDSVLNGVAKHCVQKVAGDSGDLVEFAAHFLALGLSKNELGRP